jgi:hypothetical protein
MVQRGEDYLCLELVDLVFASRLFAISLFAPGEVNSLRGDLLRLELAVDRSPIALFVLVLRVVRHAIASLFATHAAGFDSCAKCCLMSVVQFGSD